MVLLVIGEITCGTLLFTLKDQVCHYFTRLRVLLFSL